MVFKKKQPKIFVLSFQRTGTTSTGKFFMDHDFRTATWPISRKNNWTVSWFKGDFESIFSSKDFDKHQVFEDDPWWCQDFYKVLFHRFPNSKFILLERNSDMWFNSMISHSKGMTLGNTHRHASIYRRESEIVLNTSIKNNAYSSSLDNLLPLTEEHRNHYKVIYEGRIREVKIFFEKFGQNRLFLGRLEDKDLWLKMGDYFNINVNESYSVHVNRSKLKKL